MVALTNSELTDTNLSLQTQTALALQLEKEARLTKAQIAEEKASVEIQRRIAIDNLYLADMRQAARYLEEGQLNQLHGLLEKYIPENDDRDLRKWEWYYFLSQCYSADQIITGHTQGVSDLKWSPDGTKLASGSVKARFRQRSQLGTKN